MSNHPNRGKTPGPAANPPPEKIVAARLRARLTQTEAAAVIYGTLRTWQDWESGARSMHPALFELWGIKVFRHKVRYLEPPKPA